MDLVRSRPDGSEHVDHEQRLWRRVYPPTGREGLVPVAFVFADTTEAKVDNTVKVLEEAGRRYWAPRRYETYYSEAIAVEAAGDVTMLLLDKTGTITLGNRQAAVSGLPSGDSRLFFRRAKMTRRSKANRARPASAEADR
ncbi:hypothetical protein [Streptomyces sp. NPDC052092]|uniref:hypothetical protein n=1 Tax=Streptomyces sp. NPDC052092 TaxID=3365685 RepID=UPI0037D16932